MKMTASVLPFWLFNLLRVSQLKDHLRLCAPKIYAASVVIISIVSVSVVIQWRISFTPKLFSIDLVIVFVNVLCFGLIWRIWPQKSIMTLPGPWVFLNCWTESRSSKLCVFWGPHEQFWQFHNSLTLFWKERTNNRCFAQKSPGALSWLFSFLVQ